MPSSSKLEDKYINNNSGLTSTTYQTAIDELSFTKVDSKYVNVKGIGASSIALFNDTISIGDESKAEGLKSIAIGKDSSTGGGESNICIGYEAFTEGDEGDSNYSIAIGHQAKVSAVNNSIQLGTGNNFHSNTLQFLDNTIANEFGLHVEFQNPTNYSAFNTDNLKDHLVGIDNALGNSSGGYSSGNLIVSGGGGAGSEQNVSLGFAYLNSNTPVYEFSFRQDDSHSIEFKQGNTTYFSVQQFQGLQFDELPNINPTNYTPEGLGRSLTNHFKGIDSALGNAGGGEDYFSVNSTGTLPVSTGGDSISIGINNTSSGLNTKSIGKDIDCIGSSSFGVGDNLTLNGANCLVFGSGCTTSTGASNSLVFGINSTSDGSNGLILGNSCSITSAFSQVIGYRASCSGFFGISIGSDAVTTGLRALSFGGRSNASGTDSIAVGYQSLSSGSNSISIGADTSSESRDSISIGKNAISQNDFSVQIAEGSNTEANTIKYRDVQIANNRVVTPFIVQPENTNNDPINIQIGHLKPINCNAVITVNPPNSPKPMDTFAVVDSRFKSSINNIIIDFVSASQKYYQNSNNYVISNDGEYAEFLFINNLIGWIKK